MERDGGNRACRGVRGAVALDPGAEVEAAVGELLDAMLAGSGAELDDVASVIFSVQEDLAGLNPAALARRRGYSMVPLLVVREHGADSQVRRCLRALMLVNSPLPQAQVHHAYLGPAARLRPDLVATPGDGG